MVWSGGLTIMHYAVNLKDTRIVHDACEKYPALVTEASLQGLTPLKLLANMYSTADQDAKNILNAIAVELIEHGADAADIAGVVDLSAVDIHACHDQFVVTYATLDLADNVHQVADDLMGAHVADMHD